MRGTIVCGVSDSEAGRGALAVAAELSERLRLRLVLVHVAEGIAPLDGNGEGSESVTARAGREGAARLVARLAAEHGVAGRAEQRSAVGDPAALLGQIAAEEAADVIVVGARERGRLRRRLESRLVRQLETETPVPVLIAPPRKGVCQEVRAITAAPALTSHSWLAVVRSSGASSPSIPGCWARLRLCCYSARSRSTRRSSSRRR